MFILEEKQKCPDPNSILEESLEVSMMITVEAKSWHSNKNSKLRFALLANIMETWAVVWTLPHGQNTN